MSDQFDTGVVTIMFTDVEGSTDLTRRLGDEVARRTIEEHKRIIRAQIAEHDGREIDSIGDGFMITFLSTGAPSPAPSPSTRLWQTTPASIRMRSCA